MTPGIESSSSSPKILPDDQIFRYAPEAETEAEASKVVRSQKKTAATSSPPPWLDTVLITHANPMHWRISFSEDGQRCRKSVFKGLMNLDNEFEALWLLSTYGFPVPAPLSYQVIGDYEVLNTEYIHGQTLGRHLQTFNGVAKVE